MSDRNPYSATEVDLSEGGQDATEKKWGLGERNSRLFYIHAGFVVLYLFGCSLVFFDSSDITVPPVVVLCVCAMLACLHGVAAYGDSRGAPYGRLITRILGCLTLLGFPIGTIIGAIMLWDTGQKWQAEGEPVSHW